MRDKLTEILNLIQKENEHQVEYWRNIIVNSKNLKYDEVYAFLQASMLEQGQRGLIKEMLGAEE